MKKRRAAPFQVRHAGQMPAPTDDPANADSLDPGAAQKFALSGWLIVGVSLLGTAFIWSYWPTLVRLVQSWTNEPDYLHGYLVAPVALFYLWTRRGAIPHIELPGVQPQLAWAGFLLILAAGAMRVLSGFLYTDALDAWSIPLWLAGACWLFAGYLWFRWALPALAYLCFMIPLPYRVEHLFGTQLQRATTLAGCWLLQSLGLPALAEGNVILMDQGQLDVADVCAGLRIVVPVAALAVAFAAISRRPLWVKLCLLAGILPVALASCALRTTLAGWFCASASDEASRRLALEIAGWTALPVAAALLGGLLWYAERMVLSVKPFESSDLRMQGRPSAAS